MIRKLLLLIILIIFPTLTFGQTFTDNAVGTRTWTVPNGVTSITVEIWGGGGAGGGSQNGGRGGSGGGGGGYSTKLINVIPGQVISYTIGSGGTGGTGTGGNGNPSTLSHTQSSTTMSVGGGIGGKVSTNSGTVTGSAGGNASGGDTNRNGNTGDNAGGSAGAGGGSGPAPGANGGGAGSSGDGGDGSIGGGGGGGQRGSFSFTNRSGGNGGAGRVQFTYTTGAYKSRIISANTGSVTWCAGETRTVTVDIQNVGTATWVDGTGGAPDFNIGIKWNNGTGGSWDDYNVRVNAGNLASGATRTYTFNITASNNINTPQPGFPVTGYTTPLDGGTNNLTFDVVYEGVAWFGNNPAGVGPGNSTFTTPNQTIYPATPANRTTGSTAASVCPGTGTNITVANSEIGVSYQLRDAANNPIGLPVAGNNGTINLPTGNLASTTTFNVLAVGCSSSVQMTGTVTITVSSVTGTPVGTYLFCIDNTNSMATATVNSGQHVLVNVTKGFTYTFTVGDVFAGTTVSEYLAIFDGSNNAAIITNSGPSGTSIANWVSPFSGQIKILLSAGGTCSNSGTTGGAITLNLIGVNNTEDNQLVSGTNSWIGHVYNITGAPPATNASNAALINPSGLRGYVGYVTKAETFGIENFGGNTACYSTLSNGVNRSNIYTETFAVRYRMRSTKTGCYMVTVRGDDGVRLFVDGVSVFDAFTDHSTQTFGNVMVNLTGNSELVLDYYENGTVNEVSFDMVAFDNTTNTVTPASRTLCSGQTQLLDGSAYLYNGGANPTIKYQWQSSTNNAAFSDILGATTEDYTPPAETTTTTNTIYYYRRAVSATASNAGACIYYSNSVAITTSPGVPVFAAAATISGTAGQCNASTGQVYSIAAATNAVTYTWVLPTGWSITGGFGTNSITVTTGTTGQNGNITVVAVNGCGNSTPTKTLAVTVRALPTISSHPSTAGQTVCENTAITALSVAATAGSGTISDYKWYSNTTNSNTGGTLVATNTSAATTNTYTPANTTAGTLYYYVIVTNSNGCTVTSNVSGAITVNPIATLTLTTGTANQTVCAGTAISNTVYTWGGSATDVTVTNTIGLTVTKDLIAKTITISGIPTATGTYSIATTGQTSPCTAVSLSGNITVNPIATLALTTGTADQTICAGTAISSTVYTWGGSATDVTVTNTIGLTVVKNGPAKTVTISGTPTATGTYSIATNGQTSPCTAVSLSGNITVNPISTLTLTTGTANQTVCAGTAISNTVYTWGGSATDVTVTNTIGLTVTKNVAAKTVTISGTPTGGGTYSVVTTGHTSPCTAVSLSGTITVNPIATLALTTGTADQSVCAGTAISSTVYTWGGSATDVTVTNTIGLTVVKNATAKTVTISGTPTAGGTYSVATTGQTSPCTAISLSGTITVNPKPVAPTASVTKQPTCGDLTGTITISSPAPAAGITYSIDGTVFTNTTGVFTGLSAGAYNNIKVKNSSGCESNAASVTINAAAAKVWNGSSSGNWNTASNWTPSGVPVSTDCVQISSAPNGAVISGTNTEYIVHSLIIDNSASLTVNSTNTLKVTNAVTVGASGSLIFEDSSSLLQTTTSGSVNTGNITYKRKTSVRRYDLTQWASPVTATPGFTLNNLSPLTLADKYYSYDASAAVPWVVNYGGTLPMAKGQGYSVRAPQTFDIVIPYVFEAEFKGVPNNGNISVTPQANKWTLIGNPYPSAVNASKLIGDNLSLGSLYFWTHNTSPTGTGGTYSSSDYAVYNLSGGTIAAPSGGARPSGYIGAGQSFFAKPNSAAAVVFTNEQRIDANNTQFYKTDNADKNRIWLNFTNTEGAFKQLLLGYFEGATNSWDTNYDAATISGNSYVDFYTISESKKLTIQGRAMPFDEKEVIPLGYKTTAAGDFTIAIDTAEGLFGAQAVYLEDKTTGKIQDLTAGNYTFTTEVGTFTSRFVLSYVNKTLGNDDFENLKDGLLVSVKDKTVKITSSKENIKEVTVYDISGKLIHSSKKVGTPELQISNLQAGNQVLIVKINLENDFTASRKIIFH